MVKKGKNSAETQTSLLHHELRQLRKGNGLTHSKLRQSKQLQKIVAKHVGLSEAELSTGQLYSFLVYELEELGNSIEIDSLKNAFALSQKNNPRALTERREDFALQVGRHPDTIESYENRTLEELVHRLMMRPAGHKKPSEVAKVSPPIAKRVTDDPYDSLKKAAVVCLNGLYSLGDEGASILQAFDHSPRPFLDVHYTCALSPSEQHPDRYTFNINYRLKTTKTTFRLGVCTTAQDTGVLMAAGLVDEIMQLSSDVDITSEVSTIVKRWRIVIHDPQKPGSTTLRLSEVSARERQQLLSNVWQLDADACRIVEATVPEVFHDADVIYEIMADLDIHSDEHYAFWEAPSLMYVNTVTIDLSKVKNLADFTVKPFLGSRFPTVLESKTHIFHLSVNSWVMPGHGVAIIWR